MNDLVKRLRHEQSLLLPESNWRQLTEQAADRIETLEAALQFYRDGFRYHVKRTSMGINLSEWKPTEELLNDCGETARSALAGEKKDEP